MERLQAEIERLRKAHSHRALKPATGRDFTSNDYLGLAAHPGLGEAVKAALDDYGIVGAGGSRLLRGHHPLHAELETRAAAFFRTSKALYFGSGYLANLALFTTLPDRHDGVIFDDFVHASMKEGIHAGTAARFKAAHNDAGSFRDCVARARASGAKNIWIAVESLYSMDGDFAPLTDLAALAQESGAMLIIDEAHASGVYGASGRGVSEGLPGEHVIAVHTCGKALGVSGALVTASETVVDYLVNKARPFIYSTASPPMLAAALTRALDLIDEEPWRREQLKARIAFAHRTFAGAAGEALRFAGSQIMPVVLGGEERTLKTSAALQERGFDVRAIRPPTVPQGTSRLRISINAMQSETDISELGAALARVLESVPA